MRASTPTLLILAVIVASVFSKASEVKIKSVSFLGSGCPAGSADVQVDSSGTLFEATFSEYESQTGPGVKSVDRRKNCKLTLNMEFAPGSQSFILHSDMIGSAQIPILDNGQCTNTFSFTGSGLAQDSSIMLPGLYSGTFDLSSHPNLSFSSPCEGSTAILSMNTACNIAQEHLPALINVDHISGKLSVISAEQAGSCTKS